MDNASGNDPNVPPGDEEMEAGLGEMIGQTVMPNQELLAPPQDNEEIVDQPGMMEALMPQQTTDSTAESFEGVETLSNDTILASPTPVDRDPPPLVDVAPLSQSLDEQVNDTVPPPRPESTPVEPEPIDLAALLPDPVPATAAAVTPPPLPETAPEPELVEPVAEQLEEELIPEPIPAPEKDIVEPLPAELPVAEEPAIDPLEDVEAILPPPLPIIPGDDDSAALFEEPTETPAADVVEDLPLQTDEILAPLEPEDPEDTPPLPLAEEPAAIDLPPALPADEPIEDIAPLLEPEPISEIEDLAPISDAELSNAADDELPPLLDAPDLEEEVVPEPIEEPAEAELEPIEDVAESADDELPALFLTPEPPVEETVDEVEETPIAEEPPVEDTSPDEEAISSETAVTADPDPAETEEVSAEDSAEVETNASDADDSDADDSDADDSEADTEDPLAKGYVKNEFFVSEGAEDPWILPGMARAKSSNQPKSRQAAASRKVKIWNILTSIFFFGGILLLVFCLIAWLARGAIAKNVENRIAAKVEEAGLFIDYDSWKYDPVRGIVLQDLTVFENSEKVIPYAKVDNIGLNTDFMSLWKTRDIAGARNTVSFKDSALQLYDQGETVAQFQALRGAIELEMSENQIDVNDLEGQLEGLRFELDGGLVLPAPAAEGETTASIYDAASASSSPSSSSLAELAQSLSVQTAEKAQVILNDAAPKVREVDPSEGRILEESADILPGDEPDTGAPDEPFVPMFAPRKDIVIPGLEEIKQKAEEKAQDIQDEVDAAKAKVEETVDQISSEVPSAVKDMISQPAAEQPVAPTIGETAPGTEVEPTPIEPVVAPSITSSEPLTPEAVEEPKKAPAKPKTKNPGEPIELPSLAFLRDITPFLKITSSGDLPLLTSQFDADLSDSADQKIQASGRLSGSSVTMQETLMQGISFHSVNVPYRYDHNSQNLLLNGFSAGYGTSGALGGNAQYNLARQLLTVENLRSDIDLISLLTEFDPEMKKTLSSLTLIDRPEIHISKGLFPIQQPLAGTANFTYRQDAGMLIKTGDKSLPISSIRGNFKLANSVLQVPNLVAKVLDGPTEASGVLKLTDPTFPFKGKVNVSNLPLPSIAKYANVDSKYLSGLLNIDFDGTASKELSQLSGKGNVTLRNSQLYKVPVIGPIQRLLGAAIPVFGSADRGSGVEGTYLIEKGVLMTNDLMVRSDGTKVAVKGQADLSRQLTAFSARASLEGPLGMATGLASEMIEVEGRGPLQKPQIRLKGGSLPTAFAGEAAQKLLGMSDGSMEAMKAVMEDVASGGGVSALLNSVGGRSSDSSGSTRRPGFQSGPRPGFQRSFNPLRGAPGLFNR